MNAPRPKGGSPLGGDVKEPLEGRPVGGGEAQLFRGYLNNY
jgi:hypothetical protein